LHTVSLTGDGGAKEMMFGGSGSAKTVVSSVSESVAPSSHATLTRLCSMVPFGTDALTVTEIFIHFCKFIFKTFDFFVLPIAGLFSLFSSNRSAK